MYTITKNDGYLLVKFVDDFDFPVVHTAIHHETMMPEYADTNDIWLIGANRANICLGEMDLMVREFHCRCPRYARRSKTAVVVKEGLTGSIMDLWVSALRKRVAFEIEIFRTIDDAKEWLECAGARSKTGSMCVATE